MYTLGIPLLKVCNVLTNSSLVIYREKNIENINLINTRLNQKPVKTGGWGIGIGFGYGINLNNNQVISTGPSIGLGIYYTPKWLRF